MIITAENTVDKFKAAIDRIHQKNPITAPTTGRNGIIKFDASLFQTGGTGNIENIPSDIKNPSINLFIFVRPLMNN